MFVLCHVGLVILVNLLGFLFLQSFLPHSVSKVNRMDIYDTTLRDGAQGENISFTVIDKLRIAKALDEFGVQYIEGGWPGSNPKDVEFFKRAKQELHLCRAKLVAFGSTRRKGIRCQDDVNLRLLIEAETSVVTIVAKSWKEQVINVLNVSLEENLAMIEESVRFLKEHDKEVMVDAEHFFDGYSHNASYALACLDAAIRGGADVLVLCDTNGGCLPWHIYETTSSVASHFGSQQRIGIHCHNDMELAVSNSLSAVYAGASLVQGTMNGYGERTGNANLISIIPTLQLKMNYNVVGSKLISLTELSRWMDEVTNVPHQPSRPYVGDCAFAHKGGLHVSAILKDERSYQHIDPSLVGNRKRMLISELSGRGNIVDKMKQMGIVTDSQLQDPEWKRRIQGILEQVKSLENKGYTFEGAEASIELMIRRSLNNYRSPFELLDFTVLTGNKRVYYAVGESNNILTHGVYSSETFRNESITQAIVKLGILETSNGACPIERTRCFEAAEGNGPLNAVNLALKKALVRVHAPLEHVNLQDYKVRILDNESATAAVTRVMVEFYDAETKCVWSTVCAHSNIIVASVQALMDGFEYALLQRLPACFIASEGESSEKSAVLL
ncbi:(R)-citramalate synthase [Galdieria sulphuraria]|nr:(R)-citramalate synthase [Galdieria sulphuraria]